jgi:hypothetical protein
LFRAKNLNVKLCFGFFEGRKKRENGREEGVRKKGTHVSSSPPFVPFSLFSPFFPKKPVVVCSHDLDVCFLAPTYCITFSCIYCLPILFWIYPATVNLLLMVKYFLIFLVCDDAFTMKSPWYSHQQVSERWWRHLCYRFGS